MKEKETIRRFIVNERASCDTHTKFSGTVPLENWRTCVVVHTLKRGWHSPGRKEIWFRESTTFAIAINKYMWNSSTNKAETSKCQTGKQVFVTWRDCEELQGVPIRKDSNWTNNKDTSIWPTRYWRVLVLESPNSSLSQLQGAISREDWRK